MEVCLLGCFFYSCQVVLFAWSYTLLLSLCPPVDMQRLGLSGERSETSRKKNTQDNEKIAWSSLSELLHICSIYPRVDAGNSHLQRGVGLPEYDSTTKTTKLNAPIQVMILYSQCSGQIKTYNQVRRLMTVQELSLCWKRLRRFVVPSSTPRTKQPVKVVSKALTSSLELRLLEVLRFSVLLCRKSS